MKNNITTLFIGMTLLLSLNITAQEEFFGAGSDAGITVTSSSSAFGTNPENTINGEGMDAPRMEASRFLSQATIGYHETDVDRVLEIGMDAWIEEQMALTTSQLLPQMEDIYDDVSGWWYDYLLEEYMERYPNTPITDEIEEALRDEIPDDWALHYNYSWWQNTFTSEDNYRQRAAYALSQIFVVSIFSDLGGHADALCGYYDILLRNAFGNFRDLLEEITFSPSMGLYLSHLNNPRSIPDQNLHPDENYAREIMQLFTIGLFELNLDGTRKKDADGRDIPTYNNNDIAELAKVFTGLGGGEVMENEFVDEPRFGLPYYLLDKVEPMVMYPLWHEPEEKVVLGELVLPAGQDGLLDIEMTLDFLFNHPNVGPFISRQLIQRLVTSNPTPQYIARVASTFNNNGNGVRGDMAAVYKAILMDEEARSCEALSQPTYGKMQEPLLRYAHIGKALTLECLKDTVTHVDIDGREKDYTECNTERFWMNGFEQIRSLKQGSLGAPTVFNFYLPDHQPVGEITRQGLVAPEFNIHDSNTSINFINMAFAATQWNFYGTTWNREINEDLGWLGTSIEASAEKLARDPEELINFLDIMFTRGQLSDRLRTDLRAFINDQPAWVDGYTLSAGVIFLILSSPDYAILK